MTHHWILSHSHHLEVIQIDTTLNILHIKVLNSILISSLSQTIYYNHLQIFFPIECHSIVVVNREDVNSCRSEREGWYKQILHWNSMDFRSASMDMMFNLVVTRDELIKWRQTFSDERKLPCMNMNIGIYNWEHRSQTALIWYYVQVGRYFGIRW